VSRTQKLGLHNIPGTYSTRVFLGFNYLSGSRAEDILEAIRDSGFTPVVAIDFDIPAAKVYDCCLYLLCHCQYAVFDVTVPGGQLIEIELAHRLDTECLLVWDGWLDGPPRLSSMVQTHPLFKLNNRSYTNTSELKDHVRGFLGSNSA